MSGPSLPTLGTRAGAKASPDPVPSLLSSLVASLPGPLLVVDRDERVALASPSAEELFGFAAGELVGRTTQELFPEGTCKTPARGIRQCGASVRVEVARRQMCHAGTPLTLLWLDDVTERGRFEENLKRDLRNLERITQAKSDFVASVSHEIRTPMNAVLGMTDILLESNLDADQRELAQRIRRAGANLMTTLNDVLDLAKVEAGQLELESRSFSLKSWLAEAVELFHSQAEAKGLTLRSRIDPQVPEFFHGDAPRLRQILVNLIGNAVKFTSTGTITVIVGIEKDSLVFAVRDTGMGIDPKHLDRLFEPFAQAGSSTALEYGGTGLGLAIARRLVERMGGTIEAGSEPHAGSEFRFRVPRGAKKPSEREPARATPDLGPQARVERPG